MQPLVWIVPSLLLMAGIFHITPRLTRPDLFFAVTVPAGFRDSSEGRRIVRRYQWIVWGTTLAAIAAVLASGIAVIAVLAPGAGFLWAFLSSRRQARAHAVAPNPVVEVDLDAPEERFPGGWIVALLPIIALAVAGIWAGFNLDRLPARLAVHWGFNGPDRWVTTTRATLFGFLAVYAAVCLILMGTAWALLHASRHIATSGLAAASERRFRRLMVWMCIVMAYLMLVPTAVALLVPGAPGMSIWFLVLSGAIVFFSVMLLRSGQGGSRAVATTGAASTGDRTPDTCWKWGMVYVNPGDPSILVEKRFGIGYTVNLGNRWSWVAMAAVLVPAALGLIFLR